VRAAAEAARVAVLGVPAGLRWDRVEAEARAMVACGAEPGPDRGGDLFSLAHTVAALTHGVVSIEDAAHRVVAYAGPGEEADELRRLSILGRSCPEPYLALLRRLGVHRRVRESDEVVPVAEQPEMGARRRLVIGINAGRRPLGTIWVQEGGRPLAERAPQMLRGAARLAAAQLVDHYFQGDARARLASREELGHALLTGRFDAAALAAHLGIDPDAAADVVAVDLREPPGDTVRADAGRAEAAGIMSVHAAAHRASALVVHACGQLYAILPAPAADAAADPAEPLLRWAGDLVATLRRLTGTAVPAVLAGRADRLRTSRRSSSAAIRRCGCSPAPRRCPWPPTPGWRPPCWCATPWTCSPPRPGPVSRPWRPWSPTTGNTAPTWPARCCCTWTRSATWAPPRGGSPCTPTRCATACAAPWR
jgi:hypothetical protein